MDDISEATPRKSARERLKAAIAALPAALSTTLPKSGIKVTYPPQISHDRVMAAAKIAGKNKRALGKIVIAQVCEFEGERWTVDEIGTLLDNRDVTHLLTLVLGDDDEDEEDGSGN